MYTTVYHFIIFTRAISAAWHNWKYNIYSYDTSTFKMEDFAYCGPSAMSLFVFNFIGLCVGVSACLVANLARYITIQIGSPGCWKLSRICQRLLEHGATMCVVFAAAVVGLVVHVYLLQQPYGSLMNCTPWNKNIFGANAVAESIIATINCFYLLKLLIDWPA